MNAPKQFILIRNQKVVALVGEQAKKDHRTKANAAEKIILDALDKDTVSGSNSSSKKKD
ncbi:MAG: hypothetical protein ABSH16_05005 [Sedimentisphaerales bacterium]